MNLKNLIKQTLLEADLTPTSSIVKYTPKFDFEKFQKELTSIMDKFKSNLNKNLSGREVSFRGAKGYGQMEQTHTAFIDDVDIVLYQDKYTILLKGTEGKSKKVTEYYVDPTQNISMNIKRGVTKPVPEKPVETPHKPFLQKLKQEPTSPQPRI